MGVLRNKERKPRHNPLPFLKLWTDSQIQVDGTNV